MSNFFSKPAFGGNGLVSGFRDMDVHSSTFNNNFGNHLTFQGQYGQTHDFSLETRIGLNDFNQMGGLERRVGFLDSFNNSPFNK